MESEDLDTKLFKPCACIKSACRKDDKSPTHSAHKTDKQEEKITMSLREQV